MVYIWINSIKVQTEQNIQIAPTAILGCTLAERHFLVPFHFYMYENLSWIHDIHYRWGLPFCTQVTGAEFSMICTPNWHHPTAAHSYPLPFFPHPSFHSFLLPYALPLERCFIPQQLPFIPLQAFGLLSSHQPFLFFSLSRPPLPWREQVHEEHVTREVVASWASPCSATIRWFVSSGAISILF